MTSLKTHFKILKAFHGDAIVINTFDASGDDYNILIDGGTAATFDSILKYELKKLPKIDLLVLTHIDSDHIKGLIKYFKSRFFDSNKILCYWFNLKNIKFISSSDKISYGQAMDFEQLLIQKKVNTQRIREGIIVGNTIDLAKGITATILSPTQKILDKLYQDWQELKPQIFSAPSDQKISKIARSQIERGKMELLASQNFTPDKSILSDIYNSSSIAMILRTVDLNLLFLGDARPEIVIDELKALGYSLSKKLIVDFVKISHHGSINNTSNDLLDLIDCKHFIISTNGGTGMHQFPDREVIARLIFHPERLKSDFLSKRFIYINYPLEEIEKKSGMFVCADDFKTGNWQLIPNITLFPHNNE